MAVTKSAELIDADPMGTIPHALVLVIGDTVEALRAFHEVIDPKVRRVALIDTLQDEKFEAIRVAEALGRGPLRGPAGHPVLAAGRLLPDPRGGPLGARLPRASSTSRSSPPGGIDEYQMPRLNPLVDAYGVGTAIANAPVLNFGLDIMEIDGRPIAKRGKHSGSKRGPALPRLRRDPRRRRPQAGRPLPVRRRATRTS